MAPEIRVFTTLQFNSNVVYPYKPQGLCLYYQLVFAMTKLELAKKALARKLIFRCFSKLILVTG